MLLNNHLIKCSCPIWWVIVLDIKTAELVKQADKKAAKPHQANSKATLLAIPKAQRSMANCTPTTCQSFTWVKA